MSKPTHPSQPKPPSVFGLLGPYRKLVVSLVLLTVAANALNLVLPLMISRGIDAYTAGTLHLGRLSAEFIAIALFIFIFTYLQSVVQAYASERVARDLRTQVTAKISEQTYAFVQKITPAKLLTNLTADIDSIKMFVAQAIAALISSAVIIVGASTLLLIIDWRLGLSVLALLPIIAVVFSFVLGKVRALFLKSREVLDKLNRVINESILGAALIRVLDSTSDENAKFQIANTEAKNLGLRILSLFATMIPIVTFVANMGTVIILTMGGWFVINGSLSIGDFAAFMSYLVILIFPIFVIGFMSNIIAQATASYQRIREVIDAPVATAPGTKQTTLRGDVAMQSVTVTYGEKQALKDASFVIKGGTRTAIIGPTAAGKTQLLYALTGLIKPQSGTILFDGEPIEAYDPASLHAQVGFVFQDSIIFNLTVRENIAFSNSVTDADLAKALDTAELTEFINNLPEKLDTIVSERGTSLSGGQKQRLMLARALALNPKVLLLDDFTARVDTHTEQKILTNIARNYPELTLISVTQKLATVEAYDQIIVLMEGEVLATGTHAELIESSPEYVQIYNSQQSTNAYDVHI